MAYRFTSVPIHRRVGCRGLIIRPPASIRIIHTHPLPHTSGTAISQPPRHRWISISSGGDGHSSSPSSPQTATSSPSFPHQKLRTKHIPSLKQFILHTQTLLLYRDILRGLRPLRTRNPTLYDELRTYARREFEQNREAMVGDGKEWDERKAKYLLAMGRREWEDVRGWVVGR